MGEHKRLRKILGNSIRENVPLQEHTTLRIGGPAKFFLEVKDEENLRRAIGFTNEDHIPFLVMGGGSNLLVSDDGFDGLVIKNKISGIRIEDGKVKVKSGTPFQELVDFMINKGLSGVEKLTGIPGTVGGAVHGNAGAYGQTISDMLYRVLVFDGEKSFWLKNAECEFKYRESIFKREKNWVILETELRMLKGYPKKLKKTAEEIMRIRKVRYPGGLKSPGSFFKNVVAEKLPKDILAKIPKEKIVFGKVPAGYLLEVVGAKGKRRGDVMIAGYHGNLFLNVGRAWASDFLYLAKLYQKKVKERFGIKLEPEVQVVGFAQDLV